jgi:hypothetical protein
MANLPVVDVAVAALTSTANGQSQLEEMIWETV